MATNTQNEFPVLNIDGIKQVVKHVSIRLNEPLFVHGTFGAGKSEGIIQICQELDSPEAIDALLGEDNIWWDAKSVAQKYTGCMCHDACRLSSYDNVDMRGTPWPDKTTLLTQWFAPGTFPWVGNDNFPDDKIIVLFLDEFTSAPEDVMAVCYQLVLDRAVGEHKLKPNVRIVMAGNLETDNGVVNTVPMPLNNRCTHVEAGLSVKGWCEWASTKGVPPIFMAFLLSSEELLHTYDPKKPTPVVATPRTIMKAVKYYTDPLLDDDTKLVAMQGVVGRPWATQFDGYHKVWKSVPAIKDIIANPMGIRLPAELDLLYATTMKVSGALTLKNMTPLYKFLTRLDAEYVVLAMTMATKRDDSLFGVPEFLDYAKRYRDVYKQG